MNLDDLKNKMASNMSSRNKSGVKDASKTYRQGGKFKHWTDHRHEGNALRDLQSLKDVKAQISEDKKENPNYKFKHIKNKGGGYSILYSEE